LAQAALNLQEDVRYSFLLEAESTPRVMVLLEGLGKLKKSTSSGLEPVTFRLLALVPHAIACPPACVRIPKVI
jgi:hypothetical protein